MQDDTKSAILLNKTFIISINLTSIIKLLIILLYVIWKTDAAYESLVINLSM